MLPITKEEKSSEKPIRFFLQRLCGGELILWAETDSLSNIIICWFKTTGLMLNTASKEDMIKAGIPVDETLGHIKIT